MKVIIWRASTVAVVLLLLATTLVGAVSPYTSSASGMIDGSGNWTTALRVVNAQGSSGTCTVQNGIVFFQWNLEAISDSATVGTAVVTVTVTSSSVPAASSLTLYEAINDTMGTGAALGTALSTLSNVVDPVPSTLVFASTPALVDAVQRALSDNLATFGIKWSACGGTDAVESLNLASSAQLSAFAPTTAVTLRTFRSADPAVNWPLIAGGAGLLALAVVVFILRRRAVVQA